MAYLPKSMVDKKVKVRTRVDRSGNEHTDYEAYLGTDPFTQKPVRITRSSEEELKKALADWYARHRTGGDAAVCLTAMQALDAKTALDTLASAGVRRSLAELARDFVEATGAFVKKPEKDLTVQKAWDEYYATKPEDSEDRKNTKYTSGKWAATCGERKLADVTAKDVSDYMETNYAKRSPKTYNQVLLYIKTFLNWCRKEPREYIEKNPAKALEYRPEPWVEPEYMKVADVERLFAVLEAQKDVHPEYLAYAVTNFFCGCRAVEVVRMATDPDDCKINLEGETVRIAKGKGFQQGKRPRAFQIHPTGLAWMRSFDFKSALARITKFTAQEMYALAEAEGVPMFKNCGRHTFITYHVAAYGEPAKTQAMVGTGTKMMADNYRGLASKKDGEAYFAILPRAEGARIAVDERRVA